VPRRGDGALLLVLSNPHIIKPSKGSFIPSPRTFELPTGLAPTYDAIRPALITWGLGCSR